MAVWNIVRGLLDRGTTIVLTTQYLEEADRLADSVAVIDRGTIVAVGTPEQLKASIGGKKLTVRLADPADCAAIDSLLAERHRSAGVPGDDPLDIGIPVRDSGDAGQIVRALLESGIAIERFALDEPTLDEVFLTLTAAERPKEVVS